MTDYMYQNMEKQLVSIINLNDQYYIVQYCNPFVPYVNNTNFTTLVDAIQNYNTFKDSIPNLVKLVVNDARNDTKLVSILKNIIQRFAKKN